MEGNQLARSSSISGYADVEIDLVGDVVPGSDFAIERAATGEFRNWEGWQPEAFWFPSSLLRELETGRAALPYALVWNVIDGEELRLVSKNGGAPASFAHAARPASALASAPDPLDLLLATMSSLGAGSVVGSPGGSVSGSTASLSPSPPLSPSTPLLSMPSVRSTAGGRFGVALLITLAVALAGFAGYLIGKLSGTDAARAALAASELPIESLEERSSALNGLEAKLRTLTSQVEQGRTEVQARSEELDQREVELRRREQEVEAAQTKVQALESARAALEGERRTVASERAAIDAEQAFVIRERARLDADRRALEQREATLQNRSEQIVREWNTVVDQAPGDIFGAIALDGSVTIWAGWNYNSERAAEQHVLQRCSSESRSGNCRTYNFTGGCIAVARSPNGGWGVDTGLSRNEAGTKAVVQCRRAGNSGCRVTPDQAFCIGE